MNKDIEVIKTFINETGLWVGSVSGGMAMRSLGMLESTLNIKSQTRESVSDDWGVEYHIQYNLPIGGWTDVTSNGPMTDIEQARTQKCKECAFHNKDREGPLAFRIVKRAFSVVL